MIIGNPAFDEMEGCYVFDQNIRRITHCSKFATTE